MSLQPQEWKDAVARLIDQAREGGMLPMRSQPATTPLDVVGAFIAGVVIGAGVTALLTPRTGREVRDAIGKGATDLRDTVNRRAENVAARVRTA
jgi:hypothetical protein